MNKLEEFLRDLLKNHEGTLCMADPQSVRVIVPTLEYRRLRLDGLIALAVQYELLTEGQSRDDLINMLEKHEFKFDGGNEVAIHYKRNRPIAAN